jgi:protein phosphatase
MFRSDIHFAEKADVGERSAQEDYSVFQVGPNGEELLAILADGMGGHSGGQVASHKAVNAFQATFRAYPSGSVATKLGVSLNQANTELSNAVRDEGHLDGMGCTLVGTHFSEEGLQWISVGDSPLFLYRGGALRRLNADHSMAPVIEESVRRGSITRQDALSHPDRHALRSAVTGTDITLIDTSITPVSLLQDDVVILASDGLLTLSDKEICSVIQGKLGSSARDISHALISAVAAKKKPRQDNTTVQVVVAPRALGTLTGSTALPLWLVAAAFVLVLAGGLIYAWNEGMLWHPAPSASNEKNEKPEVTPTPVPVDPTVPELAKPDPEVLLPEKKASEPPPVQNKDERSRPSKIETKPKQGERKNSGERRVDPNEKEKSPQIAKPSLAASSVVTAPVPPASIAVVVPIPPDSKVVISPVATASSAAAGSTAASSDASSASAVSLEKEKCPLAYTQSNGTHCAPTENLHPN